MDHIVHLDYSTWPYGTLFNTFDAQQAEHCVALEVARPSIAEGASSDRAGSNAVTSVLRSGGSKVAEQNCVFCTFALFSTVASAAFVLCYLVAAWIVTERVASAVVSRVLARRLRVLQLVVAVLLPLGVICRGLTIMFQPFDLGFEVLRFASVGAGLGWDRH